MGAIRGDRGIFESIMMSTRKQQQLQKPQRSPPPQHLPVIINRIGEHILGFVGSVHVSV